jgi:hypothetical protein
VAVDDQRFPGQQDLGFVRLRDVQQPAALLFVKRAEDPCVDTNNPQVFGVEDEVWARLGQRRPLSVVVP